MNIHHESERELATLPRLLGAGTALTLAVGAGWILYSHLGIDHYVSLPPAIDADIFYLDDPQAGLLYYYADRAGEGRPLLLVHSINAAASAYEMRPLFEHYRRSRPVYALDLPGFGFSERANRSYTPELFAQAIGNFITQVIGRPADVVALSLSSEFAARAALASPSRIQSLVLISPTGLRKRSAGDESGQSGEFLLRLFQFPLWSRPFYDLLVTRPSIRYFLSRSFAGPLDEGLATYSYLSGHRPGAQHAPLHFISGRLFTPNVRETVYQRLKQPALVIYDQDAYTSFEALPDLLLQRSNWSAARVTPTRGLPHFEQLAATTRVLDDFWQRSSVPQAA